MFQTIIVPLDGSALAQQALPIAARIARSSGGSLILFRAISPPQSYIWPTIEPPDFSEVIVTEHEKARSYLEQVAASHELSGINVITDVLEGEPASLILALAQQYQASLIVLCRHGEAGRKSWMGSVALKVARNSTIPVFVLSPQETEAHEQPGEQAQSRRVLVPLDGSLLAEEALSPAIALTHTLSTPAPGALHLASVLSWQDPEERGRSVQTAQEYIATVEQRIRELESAATLVLTSSLIMHLDVAQTLIELAETGTGMEQDTGFSGCDAIAMATHGRGGIQPWMMGSITERVLGATKLPLLIVRSKRK